MSGSKQTRLGEIFMYSYVQEIRKAIRKKQSKQTVRKILAKMRGKVDTCDRKNQKIWVRDLYNKMVKKIRSFEAGTAYSDGKGSDQSIQDWMDSIISSIKSMMNSNRPFDKIWNFYVAFVRSANAMKQDFKDADKWSEAHALNYHLWAECWSFKKGARTEKEDSKKSKSNKSVELDVPDNDNPPGDDNPPDNDNPPEDDNPPEGDRNPEDVTTDENAMYGDDYIMKFDQEIVQWHDRTMRQITDGTLATSVAFQFLPNYDELFLASHGRFTHGLKLIIGAGDPPILANFWQQNWVAQAQQYVVPGTCQPYIRTLAMIMNQIRTQAIDIRQNPNETTPFQTVGGNCVRVATEPGRRYTADILVYDFNMIGYIAQNLYQNPAT